MPKQGCGSQPTCCPPAWEQKLRPIRTTLPRTDSFRPSYKDHLPYATTTNLTETWLQPISRNQGSAACYSALRVDPLAAYIQYMYHLYCVQYMFIKGNYALIKSKSVLRLIGQPYVRLKSVLFTQILCMHISAQAWHFLVQRGPFVAVAGYPPGCTARLQ